MYRRKLITALAVGASCAGLIPAAMAGASTPPGSGGGGDYCAAHVALEAAFNGDDPSAIGPAVEAAQAVGTGGDPGHARRRRSPTRRPMGRRVPSSSSPTTPSSTGSPPTAASMSSTSSPPTTPTAASPMVTRSPPVSPSSASTTRPTSTTRSILFRRNEGTTETLDELMAMPDEEVERQGHARSAPSSPRPARSAARSSTSPPATTSAVCFIPKGTTQEVVGPDDGGRGLGTRGQRPDRHGRGGPAALHPRHARRVQRRRGWRRHDRLRLDDDDVDGHDAAATTG